tara:strand:- start:278 stop:505 length:228 start_codon:yes stop_codon:yes gene_type:complete
MSYNFRIDNGTQKINKTFDDGTFREIPCILDDSGNVDEAESKLRIDGIHETANYTDVEKQTKISKDISSVTTGTI